MDTTGSMSASSHCPSLMWHWTRSATASVTVMLTENGVMAPPAEAAEAMAVARPPAPNRCCAGGGGMVVVVGVRVGGGEAGR